MQNLDEMKQVLENIILAKKSKTPQLTEVIIGYEEISINVNQERSTFALAKEILNIFRAIIPTSKLIVLDFRKLKEIEESLYLTILNIALTSKNNGTKIQLILDRKNLGCTGCYYHLGKNGKRNCYLCKAQLEDEINQMNN